MSYQEPGYGDHDDVLGVMTKFRLKSERAREQARDCQDTGDQEGTARFDWTAVAYEDAALSVELLAVRVAHRNGVDITF